MTPGCSSLCLYSRSSYDPGQRAPRRWCPRYSRPASSTRTANLTFTCVPGVPSAVKVTFRCVPACTLGVPSAVKVTFRCVLMHHGVPSAVKVTFRCGPACILSFEGDLQMCPCLYPGVASCPNALSGAFSRQGDLQMSTCTMVCL